MFGIVQPKLESNLSNWSKINRYSRWMYNLISPFVGKRVIDIGVGVGNMMQFYLPNVEIAIGIDIFDTQLEIVQERFADKVTEGQLVTQLVDIEKDDLSVFKNYNLDTVICVNVLEHIKSDLHVVSKIKDIINCGRIILMVPSHSAVYNHMDKNAGHFRRYDRGDLRAIAEKLDLQVQKNRYFNIFGIVLYYMK